MPYYIDDEDGSLYWYDFPEHARPGLRSDVSDEEVFAIQHPTPSAAQILATNQRLQDERLSLASQVMAPILVSLQLGDATDEETLTAKAWQGYYRALKAVDLTLETPDWPTTPQL